MRSDLCSKMSSVVAVGGWVEEPLWKQGTFVAVLAKGVWFQKADESGDRYTEYAVAHCTWRGLEKEEFGTWYL